MKHGRVKQIYMVDVALSGGYEIHDVLVSGLDIQVCDALIGMDVITLGDMLITNAPQYEVRVQAPVRRGAVA